MLKITALALALIAALNLTGYPEAMLTPELLEFLGDDQVLADQLNPDRPQAIKNYLGPLFYSYKRNAKTVLTLTADNAAEIEAGFYLRFPDLHLSFLPCTLAQYMELEALADQVRTSSIGTEFEYISKDPQLSLVCVNPAKLTLSVHLTDISPKALALFREQVISDQRLVFFEIPLMDGGDEFAPVVPNADAGDVEDGTVNSNLF